MKKAFYLILCFIMLSTSFGSLIACNNPRGGTVGVLAISAFEGGYGDTWASKLAEAYKVHNPAAEVEVTCNPLVRDDAVSALQTNISSTDIFFIDGASLGKYCEDYNSLTSLTEVFNSSPKAGETEEDILIKDKLSPEVVSEMMYGGERPAYAGNYYAAPTPAGPCSLILNRDALDLALGKGNWSVPRTTDEMMALADRIKTAKAKVNIAGINHTIYPFIYSSAVEYWRYLYYAWIAQYESIQGWNNLQTIKVDGVYNQSAFNPPGKELALGVMEKILKYSNSYCDPSSSSNKFAASQKYFFQNRACMYITGDWLEREMENATEYKADLIMVRPPVISNLSQKLESKYSVSLGTNATEKDAKLCAIIDAVDNASVAPSGVNTDVFNAVKEARSAVYSLANNAIGVVPQCSVNKDLAIDFFRFMYSDEGIAIMLRETKGGMPLVNIEDYLSDTNASEFRKSVNSIILGGVNYVLSSGKDPIRYRAGVAEFFSNEKPEITLGKKSNAKTAAEIIASEKKLLSDSWTELLKSVS